MHFFSRFSHPRLAPLAPAALAQDAAQQHERALLDLFARGFLTLDQVMERLALYGSCPKST